MTSDRGAPAGNEGSDLLTLPFDSLPLVRDAVAVGRGLASEVFEVLDPVQGEPDDHLGASRLVRRRQPGENERIGEEWPGQDHGLVHEVAAE